MSNFEDVTGRAIDIGDVILYTMSTDGRAAHMEAGQVTRFNPKSIVVQPVDPVNFQPKQRDIIEARPTGKFTVYNAGTRYETKYEIMDYVKIGEKDETEQLIPKPEPYRFYILNKI